MPRIIVAALSLLFLMSLTRHRFSLLRKAVPVLLNGVLFIGFPFSRCRGP